MATLSANLIITQTCASAGHNFNIFNPASGDDERGQEIALGSDAGDISLFFTGEKNADWNTYKEQDITDMITLDETFNITVEWNFVSGSSEVNFYVDGYPINTTVYGDLTRWESLYTPSNWGFGNDLDPHDGRTFDDTMLDIQIFNRWLTAHEKTLLSKGFLLPDQSILTYKFIDDKINDYSPKYHIGDLPGDWQTADCIDRRSYQVYGIMEVPSIGGSPKKFSQSVSGTGVPF